MVSTSPPSAHRDAQPSQLELDSDSTVNVAPTAMSGRKRSRSKTSDLKSAACDPCRSRKVRCDRHQPDCSNCRKAGIECSSSDTPKRTNYTKDLRDDFSVVLKRLHHMDQTLATLTDAIRHVAVQSSGSSHITSSSSQSFPEDMASHPSDERFGMDQIRTPASEQPTSQTTCIQSLEGRDGRLGGHPAALSSIKTLMLRASGPFFEHDGYAEDQSEGTYATGDSQNQCVQAMLQKKLANFPLKSCNLENVVVGDMEPLTTPPLLIVTPLVEIYLEHINSRTPIFENAELHHAINVHYSQGTHQQQQDNRPRALIINNIVLLVLSLEMQVARASQASSDSTNSEMLVSFLKNCNRAIANLDAFLAPSLVNIQALLTLTLVTRHYYSGVISQRVLQTACRVGCSLGLDRHEAHFRGERSTECEESAGVGPRLAQILYTMERQRVFTAGRPCDLYIDDFNGCLSGDAMGQLMSIFEDVHLSLYSSRAIGIGTETLTHQGQRLNDALDRFSQTYAGTVLPLTHGSGEADSTKVELVYAFYVSRILVLRCDRQNLQFQEKMREFARASLNLVASVASEPPCTAPRLVLLASMLGNYPLIAFAELASFHLNNLSRKEEQDATAHADMWLLRTVCDHLQLLEQEGARNTVYANLRLGLGWSLDVLQKMREMTTGSPSRGDGHHSTAPSTCPAETSPRPPLPQLLEGCPVRLFNVDASR